LQQFLHNYQTTQYTTFLGNTSTFGSSSTTNTTSINTNTGSNSSSNNSTPVNTTNTIVPNKGDTNSAVNALQAQEMEKKFKEDVSALVVSRLNKRYENKIESKEDFKHLARKLTHQIVEKESKTADDKVKLVVDDDVKKKDKEIY